MLSLAANIGDVADQLKVGLTLVSARMRPEFAYARRPRSTSRALPVAKQFS
jgi:hypothetical protein